jgi:hypothetical protein
VHDNNAIPSLSDLPTLTGDGLTTPVNPTYSGTGSADPCWTIRSDEAPVKRAPVAEPSLSGLTEIVHIATDNAQRVVPIGNVGGTDASDVAVCDTAAGFSGTANVLEKGCVWRLFDSATAAEGEYDTSAAFANLSSPDGMPVWIAGGGDVSGDGIGDLVIGLAPYGCLTEVTGVLVYFGPLEGELDPEDADILLGEGTASCFGQVAPFLSDFDGDGVSDLLVGKPSTATGGLGEVQVWHGPLRVGDDDRPADVAVLTDPDGHSNPWLLHGAVVPDADGDGIWEFLFFSQGAGVDSLDGCMTNPPDWVGGLGSSGDYVYRTAIPPADLTGDGLTDILMRRISSGYSAYHETAIWSAQYGGWADFQDYDYTVLELLYPGDFNGDGQPDLVGVDGRGEYFSDVGIFLGPISADRGELDLLLSVGTYKFEITALDWDQDGRDDLIAASGTEGVSVFRADP